MLNSTYRNSKQRWSVVTWRERQCRGLGVELLKSVLVYADVKIYQMMYFDHMQLTVCLLCLKKDQVGQTWRRKYVAQLSFDGS